MHKLTLTVVLVAMSVVAASAQHVPSGPWTALIPDPDEVDWSNNNRPGYHYRGMLPIHERFYAYIQSKRERGEELSMVDNAMIRRLQALRRWPEPPVPNAFWKEFLRYLREQPTLNLNFAQGMMFSEALARGIIPMDMPQNADMRKAVEYLNSGPFRARNLFERWFGRVEPWMEYYVASSSVDMTPASGPASGVFPPTGDFNGLVIRYNISGVKLSEPKDTEGFTTKRTYTGTVAPGTVTISGTGSLSKGWDAVLEVYLRIGSASIDEEWTFKAPGSKDFSFTVQVPEDADLTFPAPQFWIRLTGRYSTAGAGSSQTSRGLLVSARLEEDPAATAGRQARADAQWREQVERTLRELGYEQTPAGREVEQMRAALAGGDAAWAAYVDRKQRELGYKETGAEAGFDELEAALAAGGAAWEQYAAAHGGAVTPDLPDVGGLQVGTGAADGVTTGAADHFPQAGKIAAALRFQDMPAGSTAVAVWTRNGVEVSRSERALGGANGWVSFSLLSQGGGLAPGRYTLTISAGETVLGRKSFTIGN